MNRPIWRCFHEKKFSARAANQGRLSQEVRLKSDQPLYHAIGSFKLPT